MLALVLLLAVPGFAAEIVKPAAPSAPSLIILPETAQAKQPSPAPALILPPSVAIAAPAALVSPEGKPLQTEASQPLVRPASREDLARLTGKIADPEARAPGLQSAFDGSRAPAASAWEDIRRPNVFFAAGPLAPELPIVEATARSIYQRLLPRLYRPLAVKSIYGDSKTGPDAGQYWSENEGHIIEITPAQADSQGMVESIIGTPTHPVQQKIEQLAHYLHEFSHVLFDAAVRKQANHFRDSTHTAMSEGFAVTAERLLIEGLLANAPALGLSPRDALDLRRVHEARQRWLREEDTQYSEGEPLWRRAYESGGEDALRSLLSSLSVERLIQLRRSDPAYQLSLGDDELVRAYLGKDEGSLGRTGLDAYGKAARGERLAPEEAALAAKVVALAGKDGRRRVFDRVVRRSTLRTEGWGQVAWSAPPWLRGSDSVIPAFALADLNEDAKSELPEYLAEAARSPNGLDQIFERPGPSQRLTDVVSRAEKLSWKPADKAAWDAAIAAWLTKKLKP